MKVLDWKVEEDTSNIREGAIELRESVAKNLYYNLFDSKEKAKVQVNNDRTYWRKSCISKLELMMGRKLSGRILEIGAGSGWCSSLLSKEKEIEELYVLDYDGYSVRTLIPMVAKNLDADEDKMRLVVGSYNNIKTEDNFFDFIISIGAIHHSENLYKTFEECKRCLKPGGFLIAIEHCHPNSYSIEEEMTDNETLIDTQRAKNLYGDSSLKIKAKDNSDHNYRIAEFEAAAYQAKLNILPYIFSTDGETADDSIFSKPQPYSGFSNRVFKPYFSKNKLIPVFDNLLVICQKPDPNHRSPLFMDTNNEKIVFKKKRTFFQKAALKVRSTLKL
jgi:ubiquinone/menaquinone biosynthesis C-methylase UbiE